MNHQVITYDTEAPSNLDLLVGIIRKTANESQFGWIQSISIRMPVVLGATFDALSQFSGQSRNKLLVKALEAAVDMLWEQMPEAERVEIEAIRAKIIGERYAEAEQGKGEGESGEV